MKQFAKPFLSILLLLSSGAVWAAGSGTGSGTGSSNTGSGTTTASGTTNSCDTGSTKTESCDTGCDTGSGESRNCHGCGSFLPRPQGRDTAAFFFPYLYGADMGDQCFTGFVGFRYQQTFKGDRIAECLFGSDRLVFEGSEFPGRDENALAADDFGLGTRSKNIVRFDPRIRNYNVDFAGRVELGPWMECLEGAYFQVNATATHSKWDLRPCETQETPSGDGKFPACYMSENSASTVSSVLTALSGDVTFGDLNDRRRFANIRHAKSKTALANIDLILGYDFLLCDSYHLGLFLLGSAPTGNKPNPDYVFSPVIGNGHHWELGGGLSAHYELWNCDDQSIGAYLDGHVEHLFKDTQRRTFDFVNSTLGGIDGRGCLSRYLLLKEFDANLNYGGHLVPAANVTTKRVESSFKVQGDASLRLLYRACGWAAALGYNVYGRTREKLRFARGCCDIDGRNFGIKGTTGVCATVNGSPETLTSTQSEARIRTVTDDVDNQAEVTGGLAWNGVQAFDSEANGEPDPVLITPKDLDIERARVASYITHKVFAHVDYQWEDCECKPYLGVGGGVEFAQGGRRHPCTANQWEVWVRTGVSF